ncbi:MAG: phosphate acyltransferase PlsX, partial [Clostridiales bacterium]|nr:phosphate acyltransferase PlsX [Clostridiales bacterium]
MKIYLDAIGGDNAPDANVAGAKEALESYPELTIELGGPKDTIEPLVTDVFKGEAELKSRITVADCPEMITNEESPVMAVRKKTRSAIVDGMLKLKDRQVDAFVSAGSTGAVLAGGMFRLGRIKGIDRPALAPLLPNGKDYFLLIDCGANVDCRPEYLAQFAMMGDAYMRGMRGVDSPRIGLINNGAEAEKGCELTKAAYKLLEESGLNFVGNIEGREITHDIADVAVCDGFVGNVVLKFMEGVAQTLLGMIKKEITADFKSKTGALLAKGAFKRVKKTMDYSEVGGAPL